MGDERVSMTGKILFDEFSLELSFQVSGENFPGPFTSITYDFSGHSSICCSLFLITMIDDFNYVCLIISPLLLLSSNIRDDLTNIQKLKISSNLFKLSTLFYDFTLSLQWAFHWAFYFAQTFISPFSYIFFVLLSNLLKVKKANRQNTKLTVVVLSTD